MNAIVKAETPGQIMETVLIKGDLSRLTPDERNIYYFRLCESVGLNPLTQPIEYITLNGKLRLYAKKDCTDQLRSIHKVSVTDMTETEREGVYIVKCKVQNAEGRTDMAIGAVNIAGLKSEALANAMMKCETKSKRRATLSICGLGLLDETEVDDIPASAKAPVPSPTAAVTQIAKAADPTVEIRPTTEGPHRIVGGTAKTWSDAFITAVQSAGDISVVYKWVDANKDQLEKLGVANPERATHVRAEMERHIAFLRKTDPISSGPQKTADDFSGDTPMEATEKPKAARGRPKGSGKAAPDMSKDYDGWVSWHLSHMAVAETPEALESLFEAVDIRWDDILTPDRETLMGARRDAESRLEQ